MFYGFSACSPVQGNATDHIQLGRKISLAAVPMDTVTGRNGKRPCGNRKTKTGVKQVHEKPRQGNGVTRTTYQWSDPDCTLQFPWERGGG